MSDIHSLKAGIIYGTDTGNTEEIGEKIQQVFAEKGLAFEMLDVTDASTPVLESFDFLVLGIPTWDFGGIQQDWEEFEDEILAADLSNTIVALYGLGDQFGYSDYFLDAMGWLYERIQKTTAKVIGFWPTQGYDFDGSLALIEDDSKFCGLAIDEDQQFEQTDERVEHWVDQLIAELPGAIAA